jgi:hypothetical protein
MPLLRVTYKEATIYEGTLVDVPRAGDQVLVDGERRRVETVIWELQTGGATSSDDAVITVVLEDRGLPAM